MRIKIKEGECKDKIHFEEIWIQGNLLPKLSRIFKIKSRDARSKRMYPYGRTRGGHARKRVARDHTMAAETRPQPRFRGPLDEVDVQFLWESYTGDSTSSISYKYPCRATEREIQRRELRVFFSFSLFKFLVIFVSLLA